MSSEDVRLMSEALALARQGLAENEQPVGAVVALDGEVIGAAYWSIQPRRLLDHAECVALRQADGERVHGRRSEVVLYTTLEPCPLCMGAAMSFRLGRIVFALEAPADGAADIAERWRPALGHPPPGYPFYSLPEVVGGVCRDEALGLMQAFVSRNPDMPWAAASLPDFKYPA